MTDGNGYLEWSGYDANGHNWSVRIALIYKTDISKTRTADIGINFWHVDILISNKSSFHAL
jgi:hypothetical protein